MKRNIFHVSVNYMNSDLTATNFVQKLKKIIKFIQEKFSRLLNDDETGELNQM